MSEHTKEPWETAGNCVRTMRTADGGGIFVADCWRKWEEPVEFAFDGSEAEANARRIVACVNACAGMKDPEAEIAALRAEVATPVLVATNRLADALADARAQRDELLTALKMVADDDSGVLETYEAVRTAIAHAEGRPA